ncbi:hypothetical protein CCACVL1_12228, partial [Corchorus capsularis]
GGAAIGTNLMEIGAESQSIQTSGPPRSTTRLVGTGGVP